jgi:hypothetical protein
VKAAKDIDKAMTKHIKFGFSTVLWQRDFAAYRDATKSGLNSLLYSDYGVSFRVILSFIHSHMTKIYDDPAVYVLYEMGHENEGAPGAVDGGQNPRDSGGGRAFSSIGLSVIPR